MKQLRLFAAITAVMTGAGPAMADQAGNTLACKSKARELLGQELSDFDATYEGNVFAVSVVRWPNARCEVKFGEVYNLIVDDQPVVVEGYAGQRSYEINGILEQKTNAAIAQLESRIALLRRRMDGVSANLRKPNANHAGLAKYIDDGVAKALGTSVGETAVPPPDVQPASRSGAPKTIQKTEATEPTNGRRTTATAKSASNAQASRSRDGDDARDKDAARRLELMSTGKSSVRMKLKDPASASFRNVKVQKRSEMIVMCGEVNSKNAFGGYTGFQRFVSGGSGESTFLQEEVEDFATVWNRLCL